MLWYSGLIHFYKTPTLKEMAVWVFLYAFYIAAIIYIQDNLFDINFIVPYFVMYILGYMIMILFYFRLNNSYYRWYEGRKNLTYLTANAETFVIKINSYLLQADSKNRKYLHEMIMNHIWASKSHLRRKKELGHLIESETGLLELLAKEDHLPNKIMELIHKRVVSLYRNEYITKMEYFELSKHIEKANSFLDNCDTIRTTKTTKSYVNHIKMFLILYSAFLPFAFTGETIEYSIILLLSLIFYAYFGCEVMSSEVENPFGHDKNDLPMEVICEDIDNCLKQIMKNG